MPRFFLICFFEMMMNRKQKSVLIIFLILLVDQLLKIYIKTNFKLGDEFIVAKNWFIIHFVENNGMAFGLEFGDSIGKYLLSIFRIIAVSAIGWYLTRLWKKEIPFGLIVSFSLIFAGALGNILDSAFYGLIFNESYGQVATFMPEGGGYASFLQGRVVDMFYFPIMTGHYPTWLPIFGGQEFIFFRPVFNIADSSITVGIFMILLFYRRHFDQKEEVETEPETVSTGAEDATTRE